MERETGIEPATSSLGSWHSTAELLPLTLAVVAGEISNNTGAGTTAQQTFETITAVRRDFNRASGSLLRIEKEGGQVLWNVRFRRGELSYLDFGFPSSSKPSVLANCSCGKVCLDRTTAARWGPLSPCGG